MTLEMPSNNSINATEEEDAVAAEMEEDSNNNNENLIQESMQQTQAISNPNTNGENIRAAAAEDKEETASKPALQTRLKNQILDFLTAVLKIVIVTILIPIIYLFVTFSMITWFFRPDVWRQSASDLGWDHRMVHYFRVVFAIRLLVTFVIVLITLILRYVVFVFRELTGLDRWPFQEYIDWFRDFIRLFLYPELDNGARPKTVSPLPTS